LSESSFWVNPFEVRISFNCSPKFMGQNWG